MPADVDMLADVTKHIEQFRGEYERRSLSLFRDE